MKAIEAITKRNTGEYAIRPFIEKHEKRTMSQMLDWTKNSNSHVRRLSSEGARPRLPWAKKLDVFIENPQPLFLILNNLKDDPSKYVQKSVANCLNDIIKDNKDLALEFIEKWKTYESSPQRNWIIKHALRNLVKQKDERALAILKR